MTQWSNAVHTLKRIAYDRGLEVTHGPHERETDDVLELGPSIIAINLCKGKKLTETFESESYVFAVVDDMKKCRHRYETFDIASLQHVVVDNDLVPLHRKLSGHELERFDEQYKRCDVAKILSNDPVVRYFNWSVGDVIEITRKDFTEYGLRSPHTYRVVVSSTERETSSVKDIIPKEKALSDEDEEAMKSSSSCTLSEWESCTSDIESGAECSDNEM